VAAIARAVSRIILVKPPSPRGVDPHELLAAIPGRAATVAADTGSALDLALADGGDRVVVCGSIYLVGDARRELRRRFGVPSPAVAPWEAAADGDPPAAATSANETSVDESSADAAPVRATPG